MLISCLQLEIAIHWRKVAATFDKAESANSLPFAVPFHVGAYKCDVVVVIKMGAYVHGCLFCVSAYCILKKEDTDMCILTEDVMNEFVSLFFCIKLSRCCLYLNIH